MHTPSVNEHLGDSDGGYDARWDSLSVDANSNVGLPSGATSERVPHRNNTYVPIPEYIDGDALHVEEMVVSLGDCFRQWSESRRYGGDQEQSAQRLLEGAYAVSRNIGDGVLARSNRESGVLLAAVGSPFGLQITPGSAGLTEGESAGVASRTHRDGISRADRMIVDLEAIYDNQSPIIQNKLKSRGLEVPHETVAYLVTLRTVAHESAHVIQGGIGKMVNLGGGPAVDYMSSLFAESSGAGAGALNEAFAEGYAELVLEKSLVELGYEKDEIDTIVHSMSHRDSQVNMNRGYLALPQSDMEIMMEHTSQQIKAGNGLL